MAEKKSTWVPSPEAKASFEKNKAEIVAAGGYKKWFAQKYGYPPPQSEVLSIAGLRRYFKSKNVKVGSRFLGKFCVSFHKGLDKLAGEALGKSLKRRLLMTEKLYLSEDNLKARYEELAKNNAGKFNKELMRGQKAEIRQAKKEARIQAKIDILKSQIKPSKSSSSAKKPTPQAVAPKVETPAPQTQVKA